MPGPQPALVYGRMTGWGQNGPLAGDVGHDVNYLSLAGVLWHLGPAGHAPVPPINLLADFGGGGALVVTGILAALRRARPLGRGSGDRRGDGRRQRAADEHLLGLDAMGGWGPRGTNLLDGGAHFYNVYETRRRRVRLARRVRAEVLRELPAPRRPARLRRPRPAAADGHDAVAGAEGAVRRAVPHEVRATSGSRSSPVTRCASRRCSR